MVDANADSGWKSWAVRAYYFLGATYYLYQWLIYAGGVGLVTAAVTGFFSSYDNIAMVAGGLSAVALITGLVLLIATFRKRYRGSNRAGPANLHRTISGVSA